MSSTNEPRWWHAVTEYHPRRRPLADWWDDDLQGFVLAALRDLDPPGQAGAQRSQVVLAHFAGWGRSQGFPLQRRDLFHPSVVERYTATDTRCERTRATYRSVLRRLGPMLAPGNGWEPAPTRNGYASLAAPYSAEEVNSLRRLVRAQPTSASRRVAATVYLLGLGAGLDGRWMTRIRGVDIQDRDGVLTVAVPPPMPRVVPVRVEFARELLELAAEAGAEALTGQRPTAANTSHRQQALIRQAHGLPRLTAKRARVTWLVSQLDKGTRLPELLHAAGIRDVAALRGLTGHVPAASQGEADLMLAGGSYAS